MITVEREVNISSKRLDLIHSIASVVANDLNITEMTVNVCSSREMRSSYDADGLCWGDNSVDIVNKRNKEDLFMVIAHEMRHSFQHLNKMNLNGKYMMEKDALEYEKVAFEKLYKLV